MEILSDPTPDMLAMPRFDDGAIDMQELLRHPTEQVVNAVMGAETDQLCGVEGLPGGGMALPGDYRGSTPGDGRGGGGFDSQACSLTEASRGQGSIALRPIKSNCVRVLTILKSRLYK